MRAPTVALRDLGGNGAAGTCSDARHRRARSRRGPSSGSGTVRRSQGLSAPPTARRREIASAGSTGGAAMAGAVVVYESLFGDAEKIARAVAEGLASHLDVDLVAAK